MKTRFGFLLLCLSVVSGVFAQTGEKPVAVVNGQTITEAQLMDAATPELAKLDANRPSLEPDYARARQDILSKTLDAIVESKLIAAEAAKLNTTEEDLLDIEVYGNVGVPTQEEVEAFYETNKASISLPREQALPQLQKYMIDQAARGFKDAFIRRLKKTYPVETYLDPVRVQIAAAGHPSRGDSNAPVTIVEFSDFECPYCGGLYPTLKAIEKNYAGKVRIVYRQFPLTRIHPRAQKAAEASLCAADQNRFWEFHDSMFSRQDDLTVESLKRRAIELKLDSSQFNACLDSGQKVEAIKKDVAEGGAAGVVGTPAMFINGRFLSGNQPYSDIRDVIEDELRRAAR